MNQSIAISLVIPIYNVEKYLADCLTSCINQTLHNIEIICVNDCTLDNSRAIAEDFARRDSRIKIIDHEKNKGLGAARNTGLAHTQGEYVWFVDSDDYIAENACQLLYDTACLHQVDILCFDAISVNESKSIYEVCEAFINWPKNVTISMQKEWKKLEGNFTPAAWLYITKRDHLKHFKFRENCFWEDNDFTPALFASCKTIRCIPFTAYYYRLSSNSIMRGQTTVKKLIDLVAAGDALGTFIKQNHLPYKQSFSLFYDAYMKSTHIIFLNNKDIVEATPECAKALSHITPIVRRIKRKEFFHNLLTLPAHDKIFIIYWHLKDYFVHHFGKRK